MDRIETERERVVHDGNKNGMYVCVAVPGSRHPTSLRIVLRGLASTQHSSIYIYE